MYSASDLRKGLKIQIDGEPVPQHECIKINVIPKSLQLIVPTP